MIGREFNDFVDDVEKNQLPRRSQKRREARCNTVSLGSAEEKALEGGTLRFWGGRGSAQGTTRPVRPARPARLERNSCFTSEIRK